MIDARQKFGEKFIRDSQDTRTRQETAERIRSMGKDFSKMVKDSVDRINKEKKDV